MSQSFTAVNLPREEEAPVESLAMTLYKEEGMEDDVGDADYMETAEQASMAPAPGSNTTKKRSPKNAQTNADGTTAPKTPRKKATPKETNEDGTPVAKATPARKKAPPKTDDQGNPIPKTPRKKAEPKSKLGPDGEPLPKTPRKASAKKMKSDAKAKIVDDEAGDMDMAGDMVGDMATATVPGYGGEDCAALQSYYAPTPNGGSSPVSVAEEPTTPKEKKATLAANGTPGGAKKKRAVDEDGDNDAFTTPTKKIKAAATIPKTGNGKGMAIATSKDQLTPEDSMMIQWRKDGKSWVEIRKQWAEMTGKSMGNSTLPNRYKRLMANIIDWKDGDLERMLVAEKKVTKAFSLELYGRMASVMVELGADTYNAAAVEKAYLKEKRDGFPHAATIDQVLNGAGPACGDEVMEAIDEVINGNAAPAGNDEAMEDAETPDGGNSDGGVPISPGRGFNLHEGDQNGVGASIKAKDYAEIDSDLV